MMMIMGGLIVKMTKKIPKLIKMMMMRGTDSINDKAKLKNYKKLKQIKLMMMMRGLIVKMKIKS